MRQESKLMHYGMFKRRNRSEAQLANNYSGREFHIEIALGKNEF